MEPQVVAVLLQQAAQVGGAAFGLSDQHLGRLVGVASPAHGIPLPVHGEMDL
jgi:hypothetical protein